MRQGCWKDASPWISKALFFFQKKMGRGQEKFNLGKLGLASSTCSAELLEGSPGSERRWGQWPPRSVTQSLPCWLSVPLVLRATSPPYIIGASEVLSPCGDGSRLPAALLLLLFSPREVTASNLTSLGGSVHSDLQDSRAGDPNLREGGLEPRGGKAQLFPLVWRSVSEDTEWHYPHGFLRGPGKGLRAHHWQTEPQIMQPGPPLKQSPNLPASAPGRSPSCR